MPLSSPISSEELNQILEALVPVVQNAVDESFAEDAKRRKAQRALMGQSPASPLNYDRTSYGCACDEPGCNCAVVYGKKPARPVLRPGVKVVRPVAAPVQDSRLRLEPLPYSKTRPGQRQAKLAPLPTHGRQIAKSPAPTMAERVQYAKEAGSLVLQYRESGIEVPYEKLLREIYENNGYARASNDRSKALPWGSSPNDGIGPNPGAAPGALSIQRRTELAKKAKVRFYQSPEKGKKLDYYEILRRIYEEAGLAEHFPGRKRTPAKLKG